MAKRYCKNDFIYADNKAQTSLQKFSWYINAHHYVTIFFFFALQPYIGFGLLHQNIPGFPNFDEMYTICLLLHFSIHSLIVPWFLLL